MDEFIKTLLEQIRCTKARDGIAKEITDHIQDQAEYYQESGMDQDQAIKEAVRQMGLLFSIHRYQNILQN
ncbi:MAG: permease prefix domain 1-containing protein [Lachnospiraceae bacterium]|nr:permease prefix domain 1-containing protein [Lachnospiraceae bacterium]